MNIDLSGKVALVTGATGDLGRVIALTLAECGADVAVHFHSNAGQADLLCQEITQLGRRATARKADITHGTQVRELGKWVEAELGAPDIVVLNAVEQYKWTSVLEQSPAAFESQFRSCVMQAVHLSKTFIPAMQAQKWGRFIAINTECSLQCLPSQSAYVSGKRGMDGVLRVLAREVGPDGITVNQVAPGWMISERDRSAGTESQPHYEAKVPLRRRGEDQDIANAVAWFASDLAGFVTGAFLPVCGGNVMTAV